MKLQELLEEVMTQVGGKFPDKDKSETKKVGTDTPKKKKQEKLPKIMAETMVGDLLHKYIENLEKGHEKITSLAAHLLSASEEEIKTLLTKFKVSKEDIKEIISLVNKTK